ncbi:MAG: hypothetical protein QXJ06_02550 [Candidatus Aenigmatarchaeota archaeon]
MLELSVLEDAGITWFYVIRDFTRNEVERLLKAIKEMIKSAKLYFSQEGAREEGSFHKVERAS